MENLKETEVEKVKATDSTVNDETTKPQNQEPKEPKEPKVEEPKKEEKEAGAEEVKVDVEQLKKICRDHHVCPYV